MKACIVTAGFCKLTKKHIVIFRFSKGLHILSLSTARRMVLRPKLPPRNCVLWLLPGDKAAGT